MTDIFTEGNVDQPVYSSIIGLRQGQHRIVCPKCSHTRKKKTERTMSVEILPDSNVKFNCWHCGVRAASLSIKKLPTLSPNQKTLSHQRRTRRRSL